MTWWQSFKFKRMRRKLEYRLFTCAVWDGYDPWYQVKEENKRLGVWKKGRMSHVTRLEEAASRD